MSRNLSQISGPEVFKTSGALVAATALGSCGVVVEPGAINLVEDNPQACEVRDKDYRHDVPFVAGDGIVGQEKSSFTLEYGDSRIELQDCRSGELLTGIKTSSSLIFMPENPDAGTDGYVSSTRVDNSEAYARFVNALQQNTSNTTADDVLEIAKNADFRMSRQSTSDESCGCAAFFPELLGDKYPSRARTQQ